MCLRQNYIIILIFFCFLLSFFAKAQETEISVLIGERNIGVNEPLAVSVTIRKSGEVETPVAKFPEIPNFLKRGTSTSRATSYANGQKIITYTITQNYQAIKEGNFKVNPIKITVNGTEVKSEMANVIVSPEKDNKPTSNDDFADFIDASNFKDFEEVKEDAFLALTTTKSKPFVGEGFTVTLAFYVAESNGAEMQFKNNEIQIPEIIKRIKPNNCWEESHGLTEEKISKVTINDKRYTEYMFYRATFYALNNQKVIFPAAALNLVKFKTVKNGEKLPEIIRFVSRQVIVEPKELPAHPLRQEISVGTFYLKENINKVKMSTGKAFQYRMTIAGDGNISTIKIPEIKNDSLFDFYPPESESVVTPQNGKIIGNKTFTFQIIPKQAGSFALSKYFRWIYFNPVSSKYDTLKSSLVIQVSGKKIQTVEAPVTAGSVYDGLDKVDTSKQQTDYSKILKDEANVLIIFMLLGMTYIFWRRK